MKNVKGNKRQWKRLMAILIVAVMLFTTPHIVGFASMGAEEASTTSVNSSDLAVQSEEADTGDKSAQKEETKGEESQEQPVKSESEDKQEEQKQSSAPEEKQTEATTEKKSETKTEAEKKVEETKTEEKTTSEKTSATEESTDPEKSSEVQSTEEGTTEESTEAISKEKKNFRYENDDVKILVKESEAGTVPDNVQLQVTPIEKDNKETQKQYVEVRKKLLEKAQNEIYDIAGFLAYDITFVDENGDKVEPDGKVQVSMEYKKITMPEELKNRNDSADTNVTVMHLEEDTTGKVKEVVDMSENKQLKDITTTNKKVIKTVDFETESFSTFTITWTRTNTQAFSFSQNLYMVKARNNTSSSYIDLGATVGDGGLSIETEDTNPVLYFSTISSSGLNSNLYKVEENGNTYRFKGAYIATRNNNNRYTLVDSSEKIVKLTGRVENNTNVMKYQYVGDTSYRTIQNGQYVVLVYTDASLTTDAKCYTENGQQLSNQTIDLISIFESQDGVLDVTKANEPIQNSLSISDTTYTYKYTVVGTENDSVEISYLRKYNDGLQYSMDAENWYDVGSEPIKCIYGINNYTDQNLSTILTADTRNVIDIDLINYNENKTYEELPFTGVDWTGSAKVTTGLVRNQLVSGYPVLSKNGKSLKGLFDGTWSEASSKAFGLNHLFKYDSTTGKYKYDSSENYAYYDISSKNTEKNFIVYDKQINKASTGAFSDGSFMPFCSVEDETTSNKYAFGMRVGFNFTQPTNGQIKGKDMIFSFSGDDDVWIFIDGKLAMDIGGVHDKASGTINFRTGDVVVNKGTAYEIKSSLKDVFGSVFADGTTHHLEMFYLERGRGASNCSLEFNIPPQTKDILEIKKSITNTDKEKYANVKFGFKAFLQDENTNGENPGDFEAIPKGTPFKVKKDGKLTGETRYVQDHNIFYLKSGESAVFEDVNPDLKFYAEEVDISSDEFDEVTIPNWRVSYVDENGNIVESSDNVVSEGKKYIARSETKIVGQNALVEFKNRCSAANKRELWITKKISEDGGIVGADETFSFKVWLSDKDGKLQPYSGDYYVVSNNVGRDDVEKTTKYSTTDGVITGIKKDESVVITQILSGTEFRIEEVNLDSDQYADYEKRVIEGTCAAGTIKNNENKLISDGTIELKKDAKVEITNTKYHELTVTKTWVGDSSKQNHDGIYVGLYDKEGKPLSDQYILLNETNGWKYTFSKLPAIGAVKELREKQANETAEFEIDGKKYVGINVGNIIFNNGRYYVVTKEEISQTDNTKAEIENTAIKGKITIEKQDSNGNPLIGAKFKIEKKNSSGEYEQVDSEIETVKTTKTNEKGETVTVASAVFENLEQGEYRITETKAPSGHSLLINPIIVNIPEEGTEQSDDANKNIYNYNGKTYYFNVTETVINNKLFDMPEAGGGFRATIIGTGIMIVSAGWYLIRRRRRTI